MAVCVCVRERSLSTAHHPPPPRQNPERTASSSRGAGPGLESRAASVRCAHCTRLYIARSMHICMLRANVACIHAQCKEAGQRGTRFLEGCSRRVGRGEGAGRCVHTCAVQGSKAEGHAFPSGIEGAGRCGRRCGNPAAAGPAGIGRFQPPSERPHSAIKRSARRGSGPPLFRRCAELAAAGPNHGPHTAAQRIREERATGPASYVYMMHATCKCV